MGTWMDGRREIEREKWVNGYMDGWTERDRKREMGKWVCVWIDGER